jgi:hypothetical protein
MLSQGVAAPIAGVNPIRPKIIALKRALAPQCHPTLLIVLTWNDDGEISIQNL